MNQVYHIALPSNTSNLDQFGEHAEMLNGLFKPIKEGNQHLEDFYNQGDNIVNC